MRKNNRMFHLYRVAFALFLTKTYEGVTIMDIEQASGMTRGAIKYYAGSKMDLFRKVIEYFVINKQDLDNRVKLPENVSLREFLDLFIQGCKATMESMGQLIIDLAPYNASRAYMSLILQICNYFPDLHEKYIENRNRELAVWISVVQRAVTTGEIRSDIDTIATARHFINIHYGQSYLDAMMMGLNIFELKNQFNNLYHLLLPITPSDKPESDKG